MLLSHGGREWIERCRAHVSQLSPLEEADLPYELYLVALHQNGHVRIIGLATEGSARSVYDTISRTWAKALIDRAQDKVGVQKSLIGTYTHWDMKLLLSYGNKIYIQECQEAAHKLNRIHNIVPLQTAQFIVAYHQSKNVRLIGFSQQSAAQGVYDTISNKWAKILTNQRSTKVCDIVLLAPIPDVVSLGIRH